MFREPRSYRLSPPSDLMAKLLITNHTPSEEGGVFLLDTLANGRSGELRRVSEVPARGITRGPDGLYFVENYGGIYRLDPKDWSTTKMGECGLTWCHDLKYFGGEFVVVASKGNRVAKLDGQFQVKDEIRIVDDPNDVCHANCLEEVKGQMLLSIFTLAPGTREQKRGSHTWRHEGKIVRLDWDRNGFDVVYEPLSQPHSLVWRDEQVYLCESFTSKLCRIDLNRKQREELGSLEGFVRGLAFAGETNFVGISHKRAKKSQPILRLIEKWRSWCGVVEVDARTWKPIRRFKMKGTQVYDLLLIEP